MILNKYPLTPVAPVLMPEQDTALNADIYACEEFIRLRDEFGINEVIETGTCFGSTTLFFADNFRKVYTTEINSLFVTIARDRFEKNGFENIASYYGDSLKYLVDILNDALPPVMLFLDDHWLESVPLIQELQIIAKSGLKPVIVIHDFKVPGHPELGFDSYNGQDFEWEWIRPYIENIYGKDGYHHYYNSKATGAKRGIIYITPKK
jgi:predicted O-methyltransferase YrrM